MRVFSTEISWLASIEPPLFILSGSNIYSLLLKGDFRPCNARIARRVRARSFIRAPERCGSARRSSGNEREHHHGR
jgi:hypothetical protein